MDRTRPRLLALLMVLLVGAPLGAFARQHYFCHAMGRVMEKACCCASAKHAAARPGLPELRSRDCCERVKQAERDATPAVAQGDARIAAPALATVEVVAIRVAPTPVRLAPSTSIQARAPPPTGPPLFLLNCSFLT